MDTFTKACIVLLALCLLEVIHHIRSGWKVAEAYLEGVEDGANGIDITADVEEKTNG